MHLPKPEFARKDIIMISFLYLQLAFRQCNNSSKLPPIQMTLINKNFRPLIPLWIGMRCFPQNGTGWSFLQDWTALFKQTIKLTLISKSKTVSSNWILNQSVYPFPFSFYGTKHPIQFYSNFVMPRNRKRNKKEKKNNEDTPWCKPWEAISITLAPSVISDSRNVMPSARTLPAQTETIKNQFLPRVCFLRKYLGFRDL